MDPQPAFLLNIAAFGGQCSAERLAETPKVGISRVCFGFERAARLTPLALGWRTSSRRCILTLGKVNCHRPGLRVGATNTTVFRGGAGGDRGFRSKSRQNRSFPKATQTQYQFCSTTMRGLIGHKMRTHGFYDPVQRAVITNECLWCRSIFSTRLDVHHHTCWFFLQGSCRAGSNNVHTVIRQLQLRVQCPLCKKNADVANHESESLSPSHDESSMSKFLTVSDYYDHIIRCHLSLPALPRERFAKVAQRRCNNTVPVARPFACWDCTQTSETCFSTRTRRREDKNELARPLRPEKCCRKQEKGRGLGAHLAIPRWWQRNLQVPQMECMALRKIWGSQPVESLSHRPERIELLNDHRDELLLQCAQSRRLLESFLCRTWLVEGDVASFQPFAAAKAQGKPYNEAARGQRKHQMGQPFMSVFAAFVNGLTTETLGSTGLEEVEMAWLHEFRKKLASALDSGSFSRDVEHSRDPPESGDQCALLHDTGCAHQILALQEDAQNIHQAGTNSTQSSFYTARASCRKAQHRRRTTSEKFRVNSSSAARKQ